MGAQGEAAAAEEEEARHGAATAALTGMHANTHLPQILGAMARCEANPNHPNPNPDPNPNPNPNPTPTPNQVGDAGRAAADFPHRGGPNPKPYNHP